MSQADTNRQIVLDTFAAWADGHGGAFFRLLADDVRWTVIGSTSISGTYTSRESFLEQAAGKLTEKLAGGIVPSVVDVIAEGDRVAVQWEGRAETKAGQPYHQTYSWVMRIADGRVTEGTAYLDTQLIADVLDS